MSVGFQEYGANDEVEQPRGIVSLRDVSWERSTEIALSATLTQLAALDRCQSEIQQADNLSELNGLRSKVEAVRSWAKNARQRLEVHNRAAELKLLVAHSPGQNQDLPQPLTRIWFFCNWADSVATIAFAVDEVKSS